MNHLFTLGFIFVLAMSSCSTANQLITTTRQPDLILSDEIEKIALVDRSKPSNNGLSVVEGIFTGEWIGADRQGRQEVKRSFHDVMQKQERFDVAYTDIMLEGSPSGATMRKPLESDKVMAISEEHEADAILVLESFDSDGRNPATDLISIGAIGVGIFDPVAYPNNVRTGWRLYDALDGRVLDEFQTFYVEDGWWAYSSWAPDAQFISVSEGAVSAAFQYAGRIIPVPVTYRRKYYKRAFGYNQDMMDAHRLVRAERWERAEKIWTRVYRQSEKRKPKRRAAYNLAVAAERNNDLDAAIQWLEEAIALGDNSAIQYSAELILRKEHEVWYEKNQFEQEKSEPQNMDIID